MSGWNTDPTMRPGDFDGTTDDRPVGGFTGEWIVRVEGIRSPEDASHVDDLIREAIASSGLTTPEVLFDESRWEGGDF